MKWRRPIADGGEPWTMEGFDALQALDRSRRRVWLGLVGSPVAAGLWADTIAMSRAFEAGRVSPPHGGGARGELFTFLWFYSWMGVEGLVGRTGLHLTFAGLVAAVLCLGLWGSVQRRDLDRRGVTARALRHERRTRWRWLNVDIEPEAVGSQGRPRASWTLSTVLQLLRLGRNLLPLASIAGTAFFTWRALTR